MKVEGIQLNCHYSSLLICSLDNSYCNRNQLINHYIKNILELKSNCISAYQKINQNSIYQLINCIGRLEAAANCKTANTNYQMITSASVILMATFLHTICYVHKIVCVLNNLEPYWSIQYCEGSTFETSSAKDHTFRCL